MKFLYKAACRCLLTLPLLALANSANADLLFKDNFSTGDLATYNDYFRWSATIPSPGAGSKSIRQVEGPGGNSINAIRFRYAALSSGESSDAKHWAERRFHLTSSVDEIRSGASSTAYPEVWLSYYLWVPANYAHGPIDPSNNKGFVTLWKDKYMDQVSAAIDWWQIDGDRSRIGAWARENGKNTGNRASPSFIRDDHRIPAAPSRAYVFLPHELGTWVHIAIGVKMSSGEHSKDGFIQVLKNGEKVIAWENLNNWHADPALQGYDRGYLLGYANSGFVEETIFYLTDFKFGTTAKDVLPGAAAPRPPVLSASQSQE